MTDEDFENLLTRLGERHRANASNAARQAAEAVRRARSVRPSIALESRKVIRVPVGFWQSKLSLLTGELARLAAAVVLAVSVSVWVMSVRLSHSEKGPNQGSDGWIPRGSTNTAAAVLRQLLPTGWRRACLAVGVSRFRDSRFAPLPGASADVEAFSALAADTLLVPSEHYVALHDENATEVSVRAGLRWLATFDRPEDQVIIYLASHAETNNSGGLCLELYDSSANGGIDLRELADVFKDSRAQIVLVADVCHAGQVDFHLGNRKVPIWTLASASREQSAFEMAGARQSVFGAAFLQALKGAADTNEEGFVTLRESFGYVSKAMREKIGERQAPVLDLPEGKDMLLAMSSSLRVDLPPPGIAAAAPAQAEFTLGDSDPCKITLDNVSLGVARGQVGLTVLPGKHSLKVEAATPAFGRQAEAVPEVWSGTFTALAGKPTLLNVIVRPTRITQAEAIAASGALFPIMACNPENQTVTAHWRDDGTLEVQFTRSEGAPDKLTALFVSDSPSGISLPALFGLAPNESSELTFEALADEPDQPVTFFVGGGTGAESLVSPVRLETTLSALSWKQFSIRLPASETSRLRVGFGVEIPVRPGRGTVVLHIRNVRLTKANS
jgi:hypothetical protein